MAVTTVDNPVAGQPRYERVLPGFLFKADKSWWAYVVKGWLLTLLPSLALSILVGLVVGTDAEALPEFDRASGQLFFAVVLFAPVSETVLMTPPVLALNRLVGPRTAVIGSAALWGALHSLAAPAWGLVIWWPFLIFSVILLFWRGRGRLLYGMVLVTIIHAMQNGVAFAALALG